MGHRSSPTMAANLIAGMSWRRPCCGTRSLRHVRIAAALASMGVGGRIARGLPAAPMTHKEEDGPPF